MLAATAVATTGLLGLQAEPSQAAARNGVCESGEFCYYYNSNLGGSVSDFTSSLDNYGTSQPSCYDYKGTGNGKGLCIKNDAASVWNRTSQVVRVYYNSGYAGSYQDFQPGTSGNLNATIKNNNASHKFLPATTPLPPSSPTSSVRGGTISRSEIISRAQYWVDHQPGAYNQGAYALGPGGDFSYRRDCSGYVSMAWHLNANAWTGSLADSYSYQISRNDLKAGDILNSYWDHVMLFDKWIDKSKGTFGYYTFGSTPVKYRTANINDKTLDGHPNGDYQARRYTKVVD